MATAPRARDPAATMRPGGYLFPGGVVVSVVALEMPVYEIVGGASEGRKPCPDSSNTGVRLFTSKSWKGRPMHRTTFCLGDQTPCYSTTHAESFCGRTDDGQPLVFYLRDPSYPSQHYCGLDLRNISEGSSFSSSHSRDVHGPKDVIPHHVLLSLRNRNWTRNREGLAMKEVTNPPEDRSYRSSYRSDHCGAAASGQSGQASGRPTRWHRHDILTGEEKPPAGPGEPKKISVERQIGARRRWETDCTSLRLY